MKSILKLLFYCCIGLSVSSVCVNANDFVFPDISKYNFNPNNIEQERHLISEACDRWIFSKKMYYAGVKTGKGSWVNGCMHFNRITKENKYESWKTSFECIRNIITKQLTEPGKNYNFSSIAITQNPNAPAYLNGYWFRKFVISAINAIKHKKTTMSLRELKEKVLKDFYENEELVKDKSTLHDMHIYIDTLDAFGMIATVMRISIMLKKMPEYERNLYAKGKKHATPAIEFNNGYLNCYLTALLQIINALDENQIDDPGLKQFQNIIREYNKDYLDDKTPKLEHDNGKLDPRGFFNKEYKKAWDNFSEVVEELAQNGKLNNNCSYIQKLLEFYENEKKWILYNKDENVYSPYWHIKQFYRLKESIQKKFKEEYKLIMNLDIDDNPELSKQYKSEIENFIASEYEDCYDDAYDIYHNANLFNQCEALFTGYNNIKLGNEEQQEKIEKFIQIRKIQDFIYSHNVNGIGDLFYLISEYFNIYPQKIRDLMSGFYRTNKQVPWKPIPKRTYDCEYFNSKVKLDTVCDEKSDDLMSHIYNSVFDECAQLCWGLVDGTNAVNINRFLDIVFDNDNVWNDSDNWGGADDASKPNFMKTIKSMEFYTPDSEQNWISAVYWLCKNGFTNSQTYKNCFKNFAYSRILQEIKKTINSDSVLRDDWKDKIKNVLSIEIPIKLDDIEYKYKINTGKLFSLLQSLQSYNSLENDIKKNGIVFLDSEEIQDKVKSSCVCVKISKLPNVMFADYATKNTDQIKSKIELSNKDYLYTIDVNDNVDFYKLIGFANHSPGHYDASVFSGFGDEVQDKTDTCGWQNIDSYYDGTSEQGDNFNYAGKNEMNSCHPVFFAWQKILSL